MLVRLFGRNFRSLRDEFELSMVAADLKGKEDQGRGVIEVPLAGLHEPLKLLRTVAIFGANASGKSTVLLAADALRWLVTSSSERAKPGSNIPTYQPFRLANQNRDSPVELGCEVVMGDSLLRYQVSFGANVILRESLSIMNADGENELIDRQPTGPVKGTLIEESKANQLYVKEMQPNVAVLSKLAQHGQAKGDESVRPYFLAINNAIQSRDYSSSSGADPLFSGPAEERFADNEEYRNWVMDHLIRNADIGICDVNISRMVVEIPDSFREFLEKDTKAQIPEKSVVISFVHSGQDGRPLEFSEESSGTRKLFNISSDLWALANISVSLLTDELGAGLHPRLLDRLVRAVNDGPPGDMNSQLIFTTHDTGLLEGRDGLPPALRRDQVFFTKKDVNGVSELYSLVEFKGGARSVHNIRKRYMSGLYGAIPSVEKLAL